MALGAAENEELQSCAKARETEITLFPAMISARSTSFFSVVEKLYHICCNYCQDFPQAMQGFAENK